jgi:hypothetical protein
MGPKRPTLPKADFWQTPTSLPPQYNNENQNPVKTTKPRVDANANEILPPRYPVSFIQNLFEYAYFRHINIKNHRLIIR